MTLCKPFDVLGFPRQVSSKSLPCAEGGEHENLETRPVWVGMEAVPGHSGGHWLSQEGHWQAGPKHLLYTPRTCCPMIQLHAALG